jgi:hypothetical protein
MSNGILLANISMVFALAVPSCAQQRFDSADAAVQAVIDGSGQHDSAKLAAIFGPLGNAILTSGNPAQDRAEQAEFSKLAAAKYRLAVDPRDSNRVTLSIGDEDWPFPVPIIRFNGKWSFDASQAMAEMQARSIGAQELDAIEICSGYVEAQQKYAGANQVVQFASHMMALADGLVPRGLVDATWDGQKKAPTPYHGYFFRILEGQGPHAVGGTHDYKVRNKLMGGFGLVAWPAQYGVTGILTFIVNQDGEVYQKDIAPVAGAGAPAISRYDPDPTWKLVN